MLVIAKINLTFEREWHFNTITNVNYSSYYIGVNIPVFDHQDDLETACVPFSTFLIFLWQQERNQNGDIK